LNNRCRPRTKEDCFSAESDCNYLETIPEADKQAVDDYFKALAHGCSESEEDRKEWINFLIWLLCTTLTGEVVKYITFFYGPGANNGKSKLMKKILTGVFYKTPSRRSLVNKDAKGRVKADETSHTSHMHAFLPPARMCCISELHENDVLNTTNAREISRGDDHVGLQIMKLFLLALCASFSLLQSV
jgi:hypothetical protein